MTGNALSDVQAIFHASTDRAVCVRADEASDADIWLPLSQIEIVSLTGMARGEVVTITGPEWLLVREGLV